MRTVRYGIAIGLMAMQVFTLASVCGGVLGGCAPNKGTVGATYLQDDAKQESRNAAPIVLGVRSPTGAIEGKDGKPVLDKDGKPTVPVESILTTNTGPGFYSVSNAKETRAVAGNTVIRSFSLTPTPEGKYVLNVTSGTDVKATATAETFSIDPKTLVVSGKGLNASFETLTSGPFGASNQSLAALKEWYMAQTDAQKQVIMATLETQKAAGGIAGDLAGQLIKALLTP